MIILFAEGERDSLKDEFRAPAERARRGMGECKAFIKILLKDYADISGAHSEMCKFRVERVEQEEARKEREKKKG